MEAEQSGGELFFLLIILDGSNGRTATLDRIDPKVLRVKSWDMKQFSLVSKLNFSFYENSDTLTQKTEIFKSLFCKFSLLWAIVIKKTSKTEVLQTPSAIEVNIGQGVK